MNKIISPLRVPVSKDVYFILNLNNYRNAHHHVLNKAKINYKAMIAEQVQKLKKYKKISVNYILYPKTRRKTDIGNVVAIHKKFFEDALSEFGVIQDDDYTHIASSSESFGEVDSENGRVEIFITEAGLHRNKKVITGNNN